MSKVKYLANSVKVVDWDGLDGQGGMIESCISVFDMSKPVDKRNMTDSVCERANELMSSFDSTQDALKITVDDDDNPSIEFNHDEMPYAEYFILIASTEYAESKFQSDVEDEEE